MKKNKILIIIFTLITFFVMSNLFGQNILDQNFNLDPNNEDIENKLDKDKGLTFYLLTIEKGNGLEYIWAWWGHTALLVRDELRNLDLIFDFGVFDPSFNFLISYLKGRPVFQLGIDTLQNTLERYKFQEREIYAQKISVDQKKLNILYQKLIILSLPQNRNYHYQHFNNNCTTIIRDYIDNDLLDKNLFNTFSIQKSDETIRSKAIGVASNYLIFYNLFNLVLGTKVSNNQSVWNDSFLPKDLLEMTKIEKRISKPIKLFDNNNNNNNKIFEKNENTIFKYLNLFIYVIILSIFLYIFYFNILFFNKNKYIKILSNVGWHIYFSVMGFLGTLIYYLYFTFPSASFGFITLGYTSAIHCVHPFYLLIILAKFLKLDINQKNIWSNIHLILLITCFIGFVISIFVLPYQTIFMFINTLILFSFYKQTKLS